MTRRGGAGGSRRPGRALTSNGRRFAVGHDQTAESIILNAGLEADTIQVDALDVGTFASIRTSGGGDTVGVAGAGANTLIEVLGDDAANTITIHSTTGAGIVTVDDGRTGRHHRMLPVP